MKCGSIALFLCAASASAAAGANGVTIGVPEDYGNSWPFTSPGAARLTNYQQEYSYAEFGGPLTIDTLSFKRYAGSFDDVAQSATYAISFYYTDKVIGLSADAADNFGTKIVDFGTFTTTTYAPPVLSFTGAEFVYDPAQGNLLMQIAISGASDGAFGASYEGDNSGRFGRQYNYHGSYTGSDNFGVVTTFSSSSAVAAVPEPASWALMLLGFGAVGAAMRRRGGLRVGLA